MVANRVVIIGAGLAGLCAAYELREEGHDVVVLESRDRPGGRVLTLRKAFSPGLYAEAGARFIPKNHYLTHHYVRELNLPLESVQPIKGPPLFYVRGRKIRPHKTRGVVWPVELHRSEKKMGPRGLLRRYTASLVSKVGDPRQPDWPFPPLEKYDDITFAELLHGRGASKGSVELLRLGLLQVYGDGIETYSALSGLRRLALSVKQKAREDTTIRGGMDRLPIAFAERLANCIRYGAEALRIESLPNEVRVEYLEGKIRRVEAGHYVVCSIPFPLLRKIRISPPFSERKRKIIEDMPYSSVTRVFLEFRRQFWKDDGLLGWALTDLPIMRCLNATPPSEKHRGILEAFMAGPPARDVDAMSADDRVSFTIEHLQKVFPRARTYFERGTSFSWDQEPWSRGAYCWFRPKHEFLFRPHLASPEGRIHFAGDHTSVWPGWMQGAFDSGRRAAFEIEQRVTGRPPPPAGH